MNELLGKSTVARRKAVRQLSLKPELNELECRELLQALIIEEGSPYWETKAAILDLLGERKCQESLQYIKTEYIDKAIDFDLVSMRASRAYVRLARAHSNDALPVLEMINTSIYSLTEGALEALGYDKMCPDIETQRTIISKCIHFGVNRARGYSDPRYGLAAACAGWDEEIVKPFLENCLQTNDAPILYVAQNAVKKKYVKLR